MKFFEKISWNFLFDLLMTSSFFNVHEISFILFENGVFFSIEILKTALHFAVINGNKEVVSVLLTKAGIDVNCKTIFALYLWNLSWQFCYGVYFRLTNAIFSISDFIKLLCILQQWTDVLI